jgi:hypothetical protein
VEPEASWNWFGLDTLLGPEESRGSALEQMLSGCLFCPFRLKDARYERWMGLCGLAGAVERWS